MADMDQPTRSDPDRDAVTFYWRPGCGFCMMLERSLKKAGLPLIKRNIWEDDEARLFVRSVANGNETVPTVTVASTSLVNPSPKAVLAVVAAEAPDLLGPTGQGAGGDEQPGERRSLVRRLLGG